MIRDGRHLFSGPLTGETVDEILALVLQVLWSDDIPVRFTTVMVNESFGHRPEVRTSETLRTKPVVRRTDGGYVGISLDTADWVTGISSHHADAAAAAAAPERQRCHVVIHEHRVEVEHYAAQHLWWVFAPERPS